jgi:hypothetical protein
VAFEVERHRAPQRLVERDAADLGEHLDLERRYAESIGIALPREMSRRDRVRT